MRIQSKTNAAQAPHSDSLLPREAQVTVLALWDILPADPTDFNGAAIADIVCDAIKSHQICKHAATINHVNASSLRDKLEKLDADTIRRLFQAARDVLKEEGAEGWDCLISKSFLGRRGLIKPLKSPAWGFCTVRADNFSGDDLVLNHPDVIPRYANAPVSLNEAAAYMIEVTNALQKGYSETLALKQFRTAYLISAKTGWRYFSVRAGMHGAPDVVVQLPTHQLGEAIDRGEIKDLFLAGINSPDPWSATI